MLNALRLVDFRRLWAGRLISDIGSYLLIVAIPYHVYQLTGSAAATGLTLAVESLPAVLVGPLAGVRVDRWNRRLVLVTADLLRAGAVLLILFADRPERVWWIYLALLAESLGTVFFRPAARAMTPVVVGLGPELAGANSLMALSTGTVRLVGPPLGALLLVWFGLPALVVLDAVSYLISAAVIAGVTAPAAVPAVNRRSSRELRVGLAFTTSHPTLRGLLILNTAFFSANAVFTALLIPFISQRFTDDAGAVGYLISALGAGYLVGAPIGGRLVQRLSPGWLSFLGQAGVGACFAVMVNAPTLVVAITAAGVAGVPGSILLTTVETTVQRGAPGHLRGRVGATFFASDAVAALVGASLAAALGAHLPIRSVLTWSAAAIICVAVAGLLILPTARPGAGYRGPVATPDIPIHRLDLSDDDTLRGLWELQRAAYAVEAELIGFDGIPPLHESLDDLRACGESFLGTEGLTGAVSWERLDDGTLDICRLVVHPRAHRSGIASALLDELDRLEPSDRAVVSTGTANLPALALYRRRGFVPTGTRDLAPGVTMTLLAR